MRSRQPICFAFLFSSLLFFPSVATVSSTYGGNESDHLALVSFKSMITLDPYGSLSSWNTSLQFCEWSGVLCGKRHRRVIGVQLNSKGLKGVLSPQLGNLSFLREFSIRDNNFQGTIPSELGRLSRLRFLGLDRNKFDGVIPTNLSSCSNLEILWLGFNKIVGSIPKEITSLPKLTFVVADMNNLTGGIPSFLGNMTSMEVFSVSGNPLGGSIPDTLGQLKSLREIFLSAALRDNQLTGPLPSSISNCSKLKFLEMSDNYFNGKLTIDFAKLRDINEVFIGNNLYGRGEDDDMKFIDSLMNCSKLEMLYLYKCNFQGTLPASIGNLSHNLETLELGGNKLYGNLPSSIGNLVGLTTLNVGDNRFTGKIPSTIGMLQKLQVASLSENQFAGLIPDAIGNLSLLIKLFLNSNRLEGNIPLRLGNCHNLSELYLDDNKLDGKIPKQILQLSSLSITLNLSQNNLIGSLPPEIGDLKMLSYLDLSHNNLSGNIPSSISGCSSLSELYLKGNLFQGIIPPSFSSLRGLVELDLSHNNLSGQIPRFLEKFPLVHIDLSFNDLEGEVPMKGVFANASAFSVLANSRLCGGLVDLGLPKCKDIQKHKRRFPMFVLIILIASTFSTIVCYIYFWRKKKNKDQPDRSSMNKGFLKVSYGQLLKATDGFSEANLIGKGGFSSVYKGILDHEDRSVVAVKVLHLHNRGAHKSFITECNAWRNIRHRNLLKIITICSSVNFQGNDFKALVYEFMPNGSLDEWLHPSASIYRPNLHQRINILIDVASALNYLHNQCLKTIVHGDLKPSNILLDDDMVAHVGDFGLVRFLGPDSHTNSSTGIRGTIGYVPPEYGLGGEMASSGDVYSFGILLLEVMTGKRPTDNIFNGGLSLHNFASMAFPDHVSDVIDCELLDYHQEADATYTQRVEANAKTIEECLASIVAIGVSCSVDSPSQRMNIETAAHELKHILDMLQAKS
uniref:receptor kinase-like protein Xa21 n=1 Tax=Erigeron canadensis TaxID=72917 RepID=UPI001CB8CCCA|nr:receptor kinase-like protein Xa21 [Erigeron canadensis]